MITNKQISKENLFAYKTMCHLLSNSQPATMDHPYIVKKGLNSTHGALMCTVPYTIAQINCQSALVLTLQDNDDMATTIALIPSDSSKKLFIPKGKKNGSYHLIGDRRPKEVIVICEGWATGCSIHEAIGYTVAVAFDCNNVEPVAMNIAKRFPNIQRYIAADNDETNPHNPGLNKALKAAQRSGSHLVIPSYGVIENARL